MDLRGIIGLAKDVWGIIKRPDTGLLFLSGVCIGIVDSVWSFYDRILTRETVALLAFSILFFILAVVVTWKRGAADGWKPFFAGTVLSLGAAIFASDSWALFPFVVACAVTSACLFATRGHNDAS